MGIRIQSWLCGTRRARLADLTCVALHCIITASKGMDSVELAPKAAEVARERERETDRQTQSMCVCVCVCVCVRARASKRGSEQGVASRAVYCVTVVEARTVVYLTAHCGWLTGFREPLSQPSTCHSGLKNGAITT